MSHLQAAQLTQYGVLLLNQLADEYNNDPIYEHIARHLHQEVLAGDTYTRLVEYRNINWQESEMAGVLTQWKSEEALRG